MHLGHATSSVDAAFRQLLEALDAEIDELNRLGRQTFHDVSPVQARGLLQRAHHRTTLRDCLSELRAQWEADTPIAIHVPPVAPPPPTPAMTPEAARRIKGLSIARAAEKLMVSETKIKAWLEEGKLKGFQLTTARWRIPHHELTRFALTNRDLIVANLNEPSAEQAASSESCADMRLAEEIARNPPQFDEEAEELTWDLLTAMVLAERLWPDPKSRRVNSTTEAR